MHKFVHYIVTITLVFSFVVQLEAVTVNPLAHICPTNKIAPRRKRHDNHPRTFGQFYNLLTPNSPSSLQEKPQEDAPDDCGEIEDYDENDISSLTQKPIRRQGYQRQLSGKVTPNTNPSSQHLLNLHNLYGIRPAASNKPTRPPPAGYFGTNTYSPPDSQKPSAYVKPVYEAGSNLQMNYQLGNVVGAPLYHVVGQTQMQVVEEPESKPNKGTHNKENKFYPNHSYKPNANKYRPRKFNSDTGILGSFVDLFF